MLDDVDRPESKLDITIAFSYALIVGYNLNAGIDIARSATTTTAFYSTRGSATATAIIPATTVTIITITLTTLTQ